MQEKRNNIRYTHTDRAQYCPANDLLPRDGRITDVSERGVCLLVQEPHKEGERVTVSFSLPENEDPLTATGVTRWTSAKPVHGRWFPMGIEWLPFEETTRERMRAYLKQREPDPAPAPERKRRSRMDETPLDRMIPSALAIFGLIASVLLAVWSRHLQQQTHLLALMVRERNAAIGALEGQAVELKGNLEQTRAGLALTLDEVARLDRQGEYFATQVDKLGDNLESIRVEYARLRDDYAQMTLERAELVRQMKASDQERNELTRRLTSVPDLRQALRDVSQVSRGTTRTLQLPGATAKTQNSTTPSGGGWIQVHEPEVLSSPDPSITPSTDINNSGS